MTVLDPTSKVVITAFTWDRMQSLVDAILDEATILNNDSLLENGHKLASMLDDAMYGGATSYDDPNQMELDFGEEWTA